MRHLIPALCGTVEFRSGKHALLMGEGREEIQKRHAEESETAPGETRATTSNPEARRLGRVQQTGAWLLVISSTINGTELGLQELIDYIFLCYGIDPPDLPSHCDDCGLAFSICHALDCKKGGLITTRHNKIRDGVADLSGKASPPHTCAATPKYSQVTLYGREGQRQSNM